MTKEQIINAWETVEWGFNSDRKAIAKEYGFDSAKTADLKKSLAIEMRNIRKDNTTFGDEDMTWFSRLDWTHKNLAELLNTEPVGFIAYFIGVMENHYKRNIRNSIGKYAKKTLDIANAVLTEKTKTAEDRKADEDRKAKFDGLITRLNAELTGFKTDYMKRVEENAILRYDKIPDTIKSLDEKINERNEKLKETYHTSDNMYWVVWKDIRKLESKRDRLNAMLKMYPTRMRFVKHCKMEAERIFRSNVIEVAKRIIEKKIDTGKLTIKNVTDDPKFFRMMITDGNVTLFCRSIIAAANSTKVTTHFRFIITEK